MNNITQIKFIDIFINGVLLASKHRYIRVYCKYDNGCLINWCLEYE